MTITLTKGQAEQLTSRQQAFAAAQLQLQNAQAITEAQAGAMNDLLRCLARDAGAPDDASFNGARVETQNGAPVLILADEPKKTEG